MAVTLFGGNGRNGRRSRGISAVSEINVTPFVDVVLVLLIIFMLTAHVMEFGIEVEVPKVRQVRDSAKELPVVTITRNGALYLNEASVNINELPKEVHRRFGDGQPVYLRADKNTIWEPIAQVMSELGEAKIAVNVVLQPEDTTDRPRQ